MLLIAMLMLTAACRLSERQQVGVLKFAATTITSATVTQNSVAAPAVAKHKPVATTCAERRLQHLHSRVHRIMTRVIRIEVIASERECPKARPSTVRS